MSNLGLCGSSVGKKISSVAIKNDDLVFKFEDGTALALYDAGQNCCEHRWMHSDDNLGYFSGAVLLDMSVRYGGTNGDEFSGYGDDQTDSQFLVVDTDKGSFTVVNYNSHNGYYGGFSLTAR